MFTDAVLGLDTLPNPQEIVDGFLGKYLLHRDFSVPDEVRDILLRTPIPLTQERIDFNILSLWDFFPSEVVSKINNNELVCFHIERKGNAPKNVVMYYLEKDGDENKRKFIKLEIADTGVVRTIPIGDYEEFEEILPELFKQKYYFIMMPVS